MRCLSCKQLQGLHDCSAHVRHSFAVEFTHTVSAVHIALPTCRNPQKGTLCSCQESSIQANMVLTCPMRAAAAAWAGASSCNIMDCLANIYQWDLGSGLLFV